MTSERNTIAAIFGALAVEAGHAIMRARVVGAPKALKADGSPVTQADLDADRCIRAGLARALPSIAVVTEEAADTHATQADRFILVDPLDGTREFVAGRDEFTVNIALIDDGVPVVGAVYAPALRRLYVAQSGAWYADVVPGSPMPELAAMQPIVASPVPPTNWRAVVSRSHLDIETRRWLDARPIGEMCAEGSSMKFCVIAEGGADVYPRMSPTMEWDTAAGHAILLASGGAVETSDGKPLRYGKRAAQFRNPSFIAWVDEICQERNMILVTGSVLAKQETFDEVLKLSLDHVERSRTEPGCVSHDVHIDCQNPLKLFFFEQWADEEALRAHFAVPASRGFVKALRALIVETTGTNIYSAERIER